MLYYKFYINYHGIHYHDIVRRRCGRGRNDSPNSCRSEDMVEFWRDRGWRPQTASYI